MCTVSHHHCVCSASPRMCSPRGEKHANAHLAWHWHVPTSRARLWVAGRASSSYTGLSFQSWTHWLCSFISTGAALKFTSWKSAHSEVYILYHKICFLWQKLLNAQKNICAVLFWREWKLNSLWLTGQFSNNHMNTCNMAHLKSASFHSCRKTNYHQKVCL